MYGSVVAVRKEASRRAKKRGRQESAGSGNQQGGEAGQAGLLQAVMDALIKQTLMAAHQMRMARSVILDQLLMEEQRDIVV